MFVSVCVRVCVCVRVITVVTQVLLLHAVERLIRDNCQIDGDDLINYEDFVESISQRYDDMNIGEKY